MTFLNPLVLFALFAAAIPVLLHLLGLRKLRTIKFSTLTFLKELQKTTMRRLKIRQWLLVLLRTLLVVLLVMAFARPTLRGPLSGVLGERAKTSCVLVFDDSYSMTATDAEGEYLQQAIDAAVRVSELLTEGDEVYLLKLSALPTTEASELQPIRNLDLLRKALRETQASFRHSTLEEALRISARVLTKSMNLNKEVYLFSDFQAGVLASAQWSSLPGESLFPASVRFFAVHIGQRQPNNIGIESITIPTAMFEPGKAFQVKARLLNAGKNPVEGFIVSLFLNGERVSQKGVDIPGNSSTDVDFTAVPKTAGFLKGMVELESDDLDFDNRRYFTLEIPELIRLLLVGSPVDLQYVRLALGSGVSHSSSLQIKETTPERLTAADILNADVILFSNPRDLTTTQLEHLSTFLESGGGMVIFPGSHTQPSTFNPTVAEKLNVPRLVGVQQLHAGPPAQESESFLTFDRVDLRHPLFVGMFEDNPSPSPVRPEAPRTVESPRVNMVARFQLPPAARTIITLSDGSPFLVELAAHNGRVLLCSVAPQLDWSDLPLKGFFVPLLHRAVSFVALEPPLKETLVGEETILRTRSRSLDRWVVVSPSKGETVVQPIPSGIERVVRFHETETPGIYTLRSGASTVRIFAVNIHPDESHTATADRAQIDRLYRRLGISEGAVQTLEPSTDIHRTILQTRFGVELWKEVLLAALIVAIVEMMVARENQYELSAPQSAAS